MMLVLCLIPVLKQQFIELINGRSLRNKHKKSSYYFHDDMINIKNFQSNLLKTDKKSHEDNDIHYIGYIII